MEIYVTAEFDSVDLADLASSRVRNISGVTGTEVLRNRLSEYDGDAEAATPIIPPAAGFANMGVIPAGSLYNVPFAYSFDGVAGDRFEPAHRRDALLKVETSDESVAGQVSSVLTNVGGRNVRVTRRSD